MPITKREMIMAILAAPRLNLDNHREYKDTIAEFNNFVLDEAAELTERIITKAKELEEKRRKNPKG